MCVEINEQLNLTSQLTIHLNTTRLPPSANSCRCSITQDPIFNYPATTYYRNFMPSFKEEVSPPSPGFIQRFQNNTSGVETCHLLKTTTKNIVIADTWNLTYVVYFANTQDSDVSTNGFIILSGMSYMYVHACYH